jgi:hypothetical protein
MPQFSATPRDRAVEWVGGRRALAGHVLVDHGCHAPGLEVDSAAKPSLRASERGCERLAPTDDRHAHAIGCGVHELGHMLESQQRSVVRQEVPVCPRDQIVHRLCSAVLIPADMLSIGSREKMPKGGRKEPSFGRYSGRKICKRREQRYLGGRCLSLVNNMIHSVNNEQKHAARERS